ncbi:MAG: phosphoribosyl-AMP cyclohydrolase [Pseudomonadales bacterium]|nr:phosphoribosyl-AMP cyclohydrolase [Pseudomonadales bacterium]MBL6807613.1 phosphoribosyl-AMP cyclohydrolase [Pseudomonadales bacterium]
MLKALESAALGTRLATAELLDQLRWNGDGLVSAIAQDHDSKAVLMLAWMNRDALEETLRTGRVCYYSRSRQALWRKGEQSGNQQLLREARIDCDGDAVLLLVEQRGPACHTGREHCFYLRIGPEQSELTEPVVVDPATLYGPKA